MILRFSFYCCCSQVWSTVF